MDGGSLGSCRMCLIAHRVNATCVNPAVVEVEQRADGDGVVNSFICIADCMQGGNIVSLDFVRVTIHLTHKSHKSLFRFGQGGSLEISQDARHKIFATQQFRRDRGV